MAKQFLWCIALLLVYSSISEAKPNEFSPLENEEGPTLDEQPFGVSEDIQSNDDKPNQREKRFFNYYGYDSQYSFPEPRYGFMKRDQSQNIGNYGTQDTLDLILKRLTDIADIAKQRTYIPPPVTIPTFVPIVYLPSYCPCAHQHNPSTPTNKDQVPKDKTPNKDQGSQKPSGNITTMTFDDRLGLGIGDSDEDNSDGSRPISFNPILPSKPLSKPAPPVEHGSSQAGLEPPTVAGQDEVIDELRFPETMPQDVAEEPSHCDRVTVVCCHTPNVSRDCFRSHNCANLLSQRPCDPKKLRTVISKLQLYYLRGQKG